MSPAHASVSNLRHAAGMTLAQCAFARVVGSLCVSCAIRNGIPQEGKQIAKMLIMSRHPIFREPPISSFRSSRRVSFHMGNNAATAEPPIGAPPRLEGRDEWTDDPGVPWASYEGESSIKIDFAKTKLSKAQLRDKIMGAIYGNCIGDAVGLATEFLNKKQAEMIYGKGPIKYENFIKDGHRSRWLSGDWTDDSDQMILILEGMLAHGGEVLPKDFAVRLRYWICHGFSELGGFGLGATVKRVTCSPGYLDDPHKCAYEVWDEYKRVIAPNGGVMRTGVLGTCCFDDLDKVRANTLAICKTTHADPRCIASCVAVTSAIALMLRGEGETEADFEKLIQQSLSLGRKELADDAKNIAEYDKYVSASSWEEMDLDEGSSIGYTLKALGAGFYCIRKYTDFAAAINDLTLEAGDADTNGAVAGALFGCRIGYSQLPKDWLEGMPHREWLQKRVDRYLQLLGLNETD